MGVDAGDFDNDGDEDLVITELTGQGSTLYVNDSTGVSKSGAARSVCGSPASRLPGSARAGLVLTTMGGSTSWR